MARRGLACGPPSKFPAGRGRSPLARCAGPRAPLQARFAIVLLLPLGLGVQALAFAADPGAPAWRAWLPFLAIHLVVPLLDAWIGADGSPAAAGRPHPVNRALPVACLLAGILAAKHII